MPRNDALAGVDASSPSAVPVWHAYLSEWTRGNTVRAVLSVAAAATLLTGSALSLKRG